MAVIAKRVFDLVKDFGTSKSPKSTRSSTTHWCPGRPGHPAFRHNIASSLRLHTGLPYDWTPRSDAPLGSPLAPSARRVSRVASRLPGTTRLRFALHGGQRAYGRCGSSCAPRTQVPERHEKSPSPRIPDAVSKNTVRLKLMTLTLNYPLDQGKSQNSQWLDSLILLCHIMSCVRGAMWLSLTHCFIKVFYDDLAKFPLPPWKRPFSGSQITSTLILSHFRNFCHLAPAASVAHSTAISVDYSRHLVGACYA